jgi:drug/metabolite transporter (DMT)-like permease
VPAVAFGSNHPEIARIEPGDRIVATIVTLSAWLLACTIWSTVWLFIKLGVTDVPPFAFAATRLLIALGILAPLAFARRGPTRLAPRDRRLIATTGTMLFTVNYALLYWAAQHVSSGLMAVLQAITPACALVIAQWLLPDERITPAKTFGLLVGLAGVAVIFADELQVSGALNAAACAAVVGSAFVVAWAYVLVRARGRHLPSTTLMAGQIASGVMPLLLLSTMAEGNPLAVRWTTTAVGAVVYLALAGSVVAFWLNYWLMNRIGATRMLLTSILEPLLAVLLGAMVLGERLTSRVAFGGALVLVSVALVMKRDTPGRAVE